MAHPRKQIRDAVLAALQAPGATSCGSKVFGNRARQLWKTELPCLLVYTESESAEIYTQAPLEYKRSLKLVIEVVAVAADNLDDQLDEILEQLERAIYRDETFGDLVSTTTIVSTEMDIIDEGEKPAGAAKLTLEMIYYWRPADTQEPESVALLTVDAQIDQAPTDGAIDSEDRIEIPQD